MFTNKDGTGPLKDFRKAWNIACRKTGLGCGYAESKAYVNKWKNKFNSGPLHHDFRRTAIRNFVRTGINRKIAMAISGHKTESVFQRYNITSKDDLIAAAKKHQDYIQKLDKNLETDLKEEKQLQNQMTTVLTTVEDFEAKKEDLRTE